MHIVRLDVSPGEGGVYGTFLALLSMSPFADERTCKVWHAFSAKPSEVRAFDFLLFISEGNIATTKRISVTGACLFAARGLSNWVMSADASWTALLLCKKKGGGGLYNRKTCLGADLLSHHSGQEQRDDC